MDKSQTFLVIVFCWLLIFARSANCNVEYIRFPEEYFSVLSAPGHFRHIVEEFSAFSKRHPIVELIQGTDERADVYFKIVAEIEKNKSAGTLAQFIVLDGGQEIKIVDLRADWGLNPDYVYRFLFSEILNVYKNLQRIRMNLPWHSSDQREVNEAIARGQPLILAWLNTPLGRTLRAFNFEVRQTSELTANSTNFLMERRLDCDLYL
jgi:hypothetical protein